MYTVNVVKLRRPEMSWRRVPVGDEHEHAQAGETLTASPAFVDLLKDVTSRRDVRSAPPPLYALDELARAVERRPR